MLEVAHAQAAPGILVFVRRPDAAGRGANLAFAPARLRQHVELAVIRQDQVRAVAHEQPAGGVDPERRQVVHFGEQRLRIDDNAVADDARHAGMQDAGRDEVQHEFLAANIDRVARVVPPLVSRDERKARREQIDDLPLALVPPLRTEHCDVHEGIHATSTARKCTMHNAHWTTTTRHECDSAARPGGGTR